MELAIHVELDVLFLILLSVIAWQVRHSVSQEVNRIIFRYVVAGNMLILALDAVWILLEGHLFPGAIFLNNLLNAVYLSLAIGMSCIWYLYVLECIGHKITKNLALLVMSPAIIFTVVDLISMKTGWIFYISEDNHYMRGPLFWPQMYVSIFSLFISMLHLIIIYFQPQTKIPKRTIRQLLSFYIVPFTGTFLTLPYSGMPGIWNCAAVSVILIYMCDQDNAIIRDSLTGLNNRKALQSAFSVYTHQNYSSKNLYLMMMDLNRFKEINDTYGHTVGDQALVDTATILSNSVRNIEGIIARFGGDEFLFMGFFENEKQVMDYENRLKEDFARWNIENDNPYTLEIAVGYACYEEGMTLDEFIAKADKDLYNEKKELNFGR